MSTRSNKLNRLSLFVLLFALLCGTCVSLLWSGRLSSAQDQERRDLNLFLDASSAGWAEVTSQFFQRPEAEAQTIAALVSRMEVSEDRLALLIESIRTSPALDSAFIGYPNGEFLFAGRSDEPTPGSFRTQQITIDGDERTFFRTNMTAAGVEVSREFDPANTYDPRERPWYLDPASEAARNWTAPYIFSSSGQPGITFSFRFLGEDGTQGGVVGIDIRLDELGAFLDQLAPGENGSATVLDNQAMAISSSSMNLPVVSLEDLETISQDPMLVNAVESVRAESSSLVRTRSEDGLHTRVTRAVRGTDNWYLSVKAQDSDFLGDFSSTSIRNLLAILAVGLATAIVVGSLGFRWVRYQDRLKAEAERDELTGLLSRRALRKSLEMKLDNNDTVSVAIVDLDGFKTVNDSYGHLVGDSVLAIIGSRIESFAQVEQAVAGRLGGDEFALIGPVETDWDKLVHQLGKTITVGEQRFQLGASVGVANSVSGPKQRTGEDILRAADHALFSVKRSGGGAAEVAVSEVSVGETIDHRR